ncbi:MAG: lipopolysaccharide transport periplasmic protein LptA [Mariprofundales bacterium]
MKIMQNNIIIGLLVLLFFIPLAQAVDTEISAEKLKIEHNNNQAVFSGKVMLKRDDFTLNSDKLHVFYGDDNSLEKAEASGNVHLVQGVNEGFGNKAIFKQQQQTIELLGNARMQQPGRQIAGDSILHNLETQQTTVRQDGKKSSQRVHMRIESADELAQ